ncbi:MAG: hypothetical protein ACYC7D_04215 [Nitrososphaerales archaeon]
MVFVLGTLDGVTLTSLVVSLVALVVTLSVYLTVRRQLGDLKSLEKGIDAYALVQEFSQRSKKFEERLIDLKIRMEILELRQQRTQVETKEIQKDVTPSLPELASGVTSLHQSLQGVSELVRSEVEALRSVMESGSKGASAKQIQMKIGRSREHTARMMNSLFKKGLVERNSGVRPFTYTMTDKGRVIVRE